MLTFPKIIAYEATVKIMLQTATITKYCYNNKVKKTTRTDK